jgi:hypothetical protein
VQWLPGASSRQRAAEQRTGLGDDAFLIGAHQPGEPALDPFRALRGVAEDENRPAETRRLLLHSPGVGEHEAAAGQEPREVGVAQCLGEPHVCDAGKAREKGFADQRVGVQGYDEVRPRVCVGQSPDGAARRTHRITPGLPPMSGDQDDRPAGGEVRERRFVEVPGDAVDGGVQGVDHGVSGDDDVPFRDAFLQKGGAGALGRGEVQFSQPRG